MNHVSLFGVSRSARRLAARGAAVLALATLLGPRPASAGDWKFAITPYGWATDVGVDVRLHERQVVDEEIPVSDLLEDLDTIVQLRFEAQRGVVGAAIDLFDVTLSDEARDVALPRDAGTADVASDVGMTILDVAGFYNPKGNGHGLSFLYGVRLLNERATIDAAFAPTAGPSVAGHHETDDTFVDALAGVRFARRLSRHWGYRMQVDASTGGTDFTWSVGPSLSYAFGSTGKYALTAGYRRMTVDFEDDDGVDASMTLSGLLVGLRTSF